jgi:hypothetical protein
MCKCIEQLIDMGYIQPNLLDLKQLLIYPIKNNKIGKFPLQITFCPICSEKIKIPDEIKRGN